MTPVRPEVIKASVRILAEGMSEDELVAWLVRSQIALEYARCERDKWEQRFREAKRPATNLTSGGDSGK